MMEKLVLQAPVVMRAAALCVWIGGSIAVGAIVAPSVFQTLRYGIGGVDPSAVGWLGGAIVGACLRKLNLLALACACVLVLAEVPSLRTRSGLSVFRLLCIVGAAVVTIHLQFEMLPAMDRYRSARDETTFGRLHRQYTREAGYGLAALLPVLLLVGVEPQGAGRRRAKK